MSVWKKDEVVPKWKNCRQELTLSLIYHEVEHEVHVSFIFSVAWIWKYYYFDITFFNFPKSNANFLLQILSKVLGTLGLKLYKITLFLMSNNWII